MNTSWLDKQIGDYRLCKVLKEGEQRSIFQAQHVYDNTIAALKLIDVDVFHQDEAVDGLAIKLAKVNKTGQFSHPNILPVYEVGEDQGAIFVAREWGEGKSLRELLADKEKLELVEALRIVKDCLLALSYIHEQGQIHGNLKPENIIAKDDHARICDAGLIAIVNEYSSLQTLDRFAIDARYLSSEQVLGKYLDIRSDIYVMGTIFYEMLLGSPPYEDPSPLVVMQKHVDSPVPALRSQYSRVPKVIEQYIHKLLSKSPSERFATPREALVPITEVLQSIASYGPTKRRLSTTRRFRRPRPETDHRISAKEKSPLVDQDFNEEKNADEEQELSQIKVTQTKMKRMSRRTRRFALDKGQKEARQKEEQQKAEKEASQREQQEQQQKKSDKFRSSDLLHELPLSSNESADIEKDTEDLEIPPSISEVDADLPFQSTKLIEASSLSQMEAEQRLAPEAEPDLFAPDPKTVPPFSPVSFGDTSTTTSDEYEGNLDSVIDKKIIDSQKPSFSPATFGQNKIASPVQGKPIKEDDSFSDFFLEPEKPAASTPPKEKPVKEKPIKEDDSFSDFFLEPEEPVVSKFTSTATSDKVVPELSLQSEVPSEKNVTPRPDDAAADVVFPAQREPRHPDPIKTTRKRIAAKEKGEERTSSRKPTTVISRNITATSYVQPKRVMRRQRRTFLLFLLFMTVTLGSAYLYQDILRTFFIPPVSVDKGKKNETTAPPIARTGWYGEVMPAGMNKGNVRGEYVWMADGSIMVYVPKGSFLSGKRAKRTEVEAYYIDKFELTNEQYLNFAQKMGRPSPPFIKKRGFGHSRQPVVGLSWEDAQSYIRWAKKRLPSEEEWEKAARGGMKIPNWKSSGKYISMIDNPMPERPFPWGETIPEKGKFACFSYETKGAKVYRPELVGIYEEGQSPYGCVDMAGNAWEWCANPYSGKSQNSKTKMVVRGGSWRDPYLKLLCYKRFGLLSGKRFSFVGVRFAVSAK